MKKIIILVLCAAFLCSGCFSSKNDFSDIINDTGNNNNYGNNYGNNNNNNNYGNNFDYIDKNYETLDEALANASNLSPYEFIVRYSDLIVKECSTVTYQQLMRSMDGMDGMEGECVRITGEFQQVLSQRENGEDYVVGLIGITYYNDGYYEYYDDPVYFIIPADVVNSRPVEGDKAILWGICGGFDTFEMSTGALNTLPTLAVAKVQLI